jgi:hypothetical protein
LFPRNTATELKPLLATVKSAWPSPFASATTIECGWTLALNSNFELRLPSPRPRRSDTVPEMPVNTAREICVAVAGSAEHNDGSGI